MSVDCEPCPACGFESLETELVAELTIDMSFPSQNQLGSNARGAAGYHYRKLRAAFASALYGALSAAKVPKAELRRRIWLTRIWAPRKRAYDRANLWGGSKAIVDCLVNRGLIVDDSDKWLDLICAQRAGERDQIHLRIEDLL